MCICSGGLCDRLRRQRPGQRLVRVRDSEGNLPHHIPLSNLNGRGRVQGGRHEVPESAPGQALELLKRRVRVVPARFDFTSSTLLCSGWCRARPSRRSSWTRLGCYGASSRHYVGLGSWSGRRWTRRIERETYFLILSLLCYVLYVCMYLRPNINIKNHNRLRIIISKINGAFSAHE